MKGAPQSRAIKIPALPGGGAAIAAGPRRRSAAAIRARMPSGGPPPSWAARSRSICSRGALGRIVARAVPAFSRKYPEVELELDEAEPEESIPRVKAGEHDLALAYDFDSVPFGEDRDVERHFLLKERMQVALPADHPLAGRRSVRLEQLADETWAVTLGADLRSPATEAMLEILALEVKRLSGAGRAKVAD